MDARFVKMHGCGNDFVIIDERDGKLGLTPRRIAALADRRTGIGCDQFIVIEPSAEADAFMRIRNPDGTEAGACGNATRCVVSLLAAETGRSTHLIRTIAADLPGVAHPDGRVTVDMGTPRLDWHDVPLAGPADTLRLDLTDGPVSGAAALSMGNPHATFFVEDLGAIRVEALGPRLELASIFPDRANIGFAQVLSPTRIRLRVWERGAGLTLACGSGACAAMVNAVRRGLVERAATVTVIVDGGELEIAWRHDGHVLMTGPVATSYHGTIDLSAYPA